MIPPTEKRSPRLRNDLRTRTALSGRARGLRATLALLVAAALALPASAASAADAAPTAATTRPDAIGAVTFTGWGWANGAATLTVDWADVPRATSYEVFASADYDAVLTLPSPTATVTSSKVTLTGLDPNVKYWVKVSPVNDKGRGPGSSRVGQVTPTEAIAGTTWQKTKPDGMTPVKAVGGSWTSTGSTLTLDWADVARATYYQVFVSTDYDGILEMTTPTKIVTTSRATVTGLKPGVKYTVRVMSANNEGRGGGSPRVSYTTLTERDAGQAWQTAKPAAMGTVKVIEDGWRNGAATLTLNWADVSRATRYEVFAATSYDKVIAMTTPNAVVTGSKATIGGLDPDVRYFLKVYAVNNIGRGSGSPSVSQMTPTEKTANATWQTQKPGAVGLVTFTGASLTAKGATLSIDWANVARASSYDVFVSSSYSGAVKATKPRLSVTSSKAVITGLKKGTSYFVRIVAANNVGRGDSSARVGHKTITAEAKLDGTEAPYSVMTWNVCSVVCGNIGARTKAINSRIRELKVGVVGLQEAMKYTKAPSGYAFAVNGQNDILIRKGVFSKVGKKGNVATTGSKKFARKYAGSGHGVTWAALRHSSGKYVVVFNTHLVVGTSKSLRAQRNYEAQQLSPYVNAVMRKLSASNPKLKGAATILIGDFNTSLSAAGDSTMSSLNKAGWVDSFQQARTLIRQHHNSANPDRNSKPVIGITWGAHVDKVWVKPSRTVITSWENAGKMKGSRYVTPLPSDHHPVLVKGYFT